MSYDLIEITLNRVGEQLPDHLPPLSDLVGPIFHQPADAIQNEERPLLWAEQVSYRHVQGKR
jgi:hypothetical protein